MSLEFFLINDINNLHIFYNVDYKTPCLNLTVFTLKKETYIRDFTIHYFTTLQNENFKKLFNVRKIHQ